MKSFSLSHVGVLFLVVFVIILFVLPLQSVLAQGSGPTFVCPCIGGPKCPPPGVVPCFENSPCGPVPGVCMATGLNCKAITPPSCAGNEGVLDAGLQGLQGLIQKALMGLMGGGGGGGGDMPPPSNFFDNQEESDPTTAEDLLENIANEDRVSPFDVLSGAFGTETESEAQANAETNSGTTVTIIDSAVNAVANLLETATGVTVGEGEITPTENTNNDRGIIRENVSSNTQVEEGDRGITLRTEVIDEDANTGVGSFFGSANNQSETVLGRLCTAQPWQSSFVSKIFSSRFFDTMCENRGYVPGGGQSEEVIEQPIEETTFIDERLGRAQLSCPASVILGDAAEIEWTCGAAIRSAGIGFETNGWPTGTASVRPTEATTYTLECSQGGTASCTVNITGPSIQIVAHPQRVPLGARTRIYWVGENVAECTVSGPGFEENTLRGAATTDAILDQTEFTLTCQTPGGSVVEAKTIVDVGI
mgnify:CR=1 FL=1